MKKYILQEDLPNFRAGEVFCISKNGNLVRLSDGELAYHKRVLDRKPYILLEWFNEVQESGRPRARYCDKYYYISDCGNISDTSDYRDEMNDYHYGTGNYGLTKKELGTKREYNLARQTLLDDAGGWKFTLKEQNYFAKYSVIDNRWHLNGDYHYTPGGIYFKDLESLKKSLKEHEEQWEIVRKYEMGEM